MSLTVRPTLRGQGETSREAMSTFLINVLCVFNEDETGLFASVGNKAANRSRESQWTASAVAPFSRWCQITFPTTAASFVRSQPSQTAPKISFNLLQNLSVSHLNGS